MAATGLALPGAQSWDALVRAERAQVGMRWCLRSRPAYGSVGKISACGTCVVPRACTPSGKLGVRHALAGFPHPPALYAEHPMLGCKAPDLSTAQVIRFSGPTREHTRAAPFELCLSVQRSIQCGGGALGLEIQSGLLPRQDTPLSHCYHAHSKVVAVLGNAGMPWPRVCRQS